MNMISPFEHTIIPMTSVNSGLIQEVACNVYSFTNQIVNVCFLGNSEDWILVDAGMPNSAEDIISAAEQIFGSKTKPKAIILTHGHFDHVGSIIELIQYWNITVYAHEWELPFLTGHANYPPAKPEIASGLVAKVSPLFPREGIQLGQHVQQLPSDGTLPGLREWQWIHTPGHTPGHISLFRNSDRVLVVGDAFVTVKQESLYKVLTQEKELSGPPAYFTMDWQAAFDSVKRLAGLNPLTAITGHGMPMYGNELKDGLEKLINDSDTWDMFERHFDKIKE